MDNEDIFYSLQNTIIQLREKVKNEINYPGEKKKMILNIGKIKRIILRRCF